MKILICSDGSEQAERAIRFGATVAAGVGAEVSLLGIIETEGRSEAILESLRRGQALLKEKKIAAELITKAGDPITEIVRRTEEAAYDLVVVGAVRKATRGLFWMSSKTYKIVKEVKPPVLIVAGKSVSLKRVLICSGGKRYIHDAVKLAGAIARGLGAQVSLLHVLADPPAFYAHLPRMEETSERLLVSNSELGRNLRSERDTLGALGVPTSVVVRHGSVLEEVLREIHEGDYDMVVTGSALSSSLRTYVLGDITREIVNRIQCAVLVVRPTEAVSGWGFPLNLRSLFGGGQQMPKR